MKLTCDTLTLTLSEPFLSHKGTTAACVRHILVRIAWEGRVGRGIAVPAKEYGTIDGTVRAALAEYAGLVSGASPFQLESMLHRLKAAVPGQSAALAAVDMALHDLLGQIAGLPLYRLLGLDGLPIPDSALSLGLMSVDETTEKARQCAAWPILKLKMSAPDDGLVSRVRDVYSGRLWIDGNGAWTPKEAVAAAGRFHSHGVELIEQPVPPGSLDALRFVRERVPMLIIADEDCVGPDDVVRLKDCVDGINIKLLKCGGIRRGLEMIRLARRMNLKVMLGCKTESVLGITAIAHLGGLAVFLDLDGHLDLVDDPFEGLAIDHGRLSLPSAAGLGVVCRAGKL